MTQSYEFNSYFTAGKTRYWAEYVDKKENGGNGNGRVDGNEIKLFTDIMKHRYNYEYSFDKLDSKQSTELGEGSAAAREMYMNGEFQGPWNLGYSVSKKLKGVTMSYEGCKEALDKLATFPAGAKKVSAIKDFLSGYALGGARNGIFEQMASEYGDAFKNKDVVPFMKMLLDNVPAEKRESKDYKFLEKTYNEYSKKPADDDFENSKWSAISSMFGCDTLDNLDEAVSRLYDI